jgi:hypothetical protein
LFGNPFQKETCDRRGCANTKPRRVIPLQHGYAALKILELIEKLEDLYDVHDDIEVAVMLVNEVENTCTFASDLEVVAREECGFVHEHVLIKQASKETRPWLH